MKDYSELKRLSDAATPGNWNHYRHGVIKGGPSIQFTNGSAQQQIAMTTGADWMRPDEQCANADFIAAANPAAVLALIAEVEVLRKLPTAWSEVYEQSDELDALRDEKLAWLSERDQLKADNDLQAKEIEALRKAVEFGADCFRKISSGDGSGHADLAESILRIAGSTISKVHNK